MAKIMFVVAWALASGLWILAMTRWRQRTVEGLPPGSSAWFWLRAFGIAETRANRERLIVVTSATGIAMTTLGLLLALVFGE
jgi:hypothetical protein